MTNHHDWASIGAWMSLAAAGISLQQGAWIATIIAALVSAFLGVLKAVDWFEARAKK